MEAAGILGPKWPLLEQAGHLGAIAAQHPALDVVQGVILAVDMIPAS